MQLVVRLVSIGVRIYKIYNKISNKESDKYKTNLYNSIPIKIHFKCRYISNTKLLLEC